jgi:hypothetical protein
MIKTGKTRKHGLNETGVQKTRWLTRQTYNRETENTGISAQGIVGKMGNTWRGVETSTNTGETEQGVTDCLTLFWLLLDSICVIS